MTNSLILISLLVTNFAPITIEGTSKQVGIVSSNIYAQVIFENKINQFFLKTEPHLELTTLKDPPPLIYTTNNFNPLFPRSFIIFSNNAVLN